MIGVSQVEAIISETGITTVQDFAQLRHDLGWTRTWYDTRKSVTDLPNRKVKVGQIEKAARKLSSLLASEDAWAAISISSELADTHARTVVKLIATAAADYNKPIKQPAWARKAAKSMIAELGIRKLSPFDWLVGVYLTTIFERHFGQPARRSRMKDGQVGGPYVRFVKAALRELGILNRGKPYSPETIARSFSRARVHGRD